MSQSEGDARPGVVTTLESVYWRIARRNAAALSAERGSRVTALRWIEEAIVEKDLSQRFQASGPTIAPLHQRSLAQVRREYLIELLESTGHNVSAAARVAGIDRHTLARHLRRYGIRRRKRRPVPEMAAAGGGK